MQVKVTLLDGSLFTCTVEVRQVESGKMGERCVQVETGWDSCIQVEANGVRCVQVVRQK